MKKLSIYDCDGVVRTFSWADVYVAYCEIAKHFGVRLINDCATVDDFRKTYSRDWKRNLARMGIVKLLDVHTAQEIFQKVYFTRVKMFDWVTDIIPRVAQHSVLCICTNNSAVGVAQSLKGVMHHFAMNVGGEDVQRLKPKPDGIRYIMETMGFEKDETVIIGDSKTDILAGKAAGVTTALVTWGATTDADKIESLHADYVLHDPEELVLL